MYSSLGSSGDHQLQRNFWLLLGCFRIGKLRHALAGSQFHFTPEPNAELDSNPLKPKAKASPNRHVRI